MSTMTYAVDGRVARITVDRPERGNGLTRALIDDLGVRVEQANLDPAVHVILLSGNGKGFCGGYDLVDSAERLRARVAPEAPPGSPSGRGRSARDAAGLADRSGGAGAQSRSARHLGPDGRLPDDIAQRARVHVAV